MRTYLISVDGHAIETLQSPPLNILAMDTAGTAFAKGRLISPRGVRLRDVTNENPDYIRLLCGKKLGVA